MKSLISFILGFSIGLAASTVRYQPPSPDIKLPPVEVKPLPKKALVQFYPDLKPPMFDTTLVDTVRVDTIPWHWDVLGRRIYHG